MGKLPTQKPGIMVRKIGQETMLYNTNEGKVHILNATAEAVWKCCDGKMLMNEAEQKLEHSYTHTQNHDIKEDIRQILLDFSRLDIVCADL